MSDLHLFYRDDLNRAAAFPLKHDTISLPACSGPTMAMFTHLQEHCWNLVEISLDCLRFTLNVLTKEKSATNAENGSYVIVTWF